TVLTSDAGAAREFAATGPTVIKAVADARVVTPTSELAGYTTVLPADVDWQSVRLAPVLLQRRIEKRADLRVTLVGTNAYAVEIIAPTGSPLDFRAVDPDLCRYAAYDLDTELEQACSSFLNHFGLRFGAFDFAIDESGAPWFLECNPAGQ